jgi:hypothetical protein
MLQGTLCLLCGDGAKDALQPLVHVAHPVGRGCQRCIQDCGHHNHVLAGPCEGGELPLRSVDHRSLACLTHRFALEQVGQPGLNSCMLGGELVLMPCDYG